MVWFKRLGNAVTTHPWLVIGAWIAAGVIVIALSPQLVTFTSNNNSSFLPSSYESVQASQVAAKYFPAQAQASGLIVVNRSDGNVLSSTDQQKVAGLAQSLVADKIPSVTTATTSPLYLSSNQKVQLVQVVFNGQSGDPGPNQAVVTVRDKTDQYLAGSGLVGVLTGNAAISVDSTNAFDHAEKIITIATILLILILLGIVFRSLLIAVLPIFVIGFVHQVAQSFTADLADWFHFELGPELAPLLVVVMFGVGTDYIVFLLFRYREHLTRGEASPSALVTSLAKVGEVITSAAATVIAAFAALLVASLESLRTLAPGLIVGILLMLVAALTLVPAILSLLKLHLFWPSHPHPRTSTRLTRSERIGNVVARHPGLVLAGWSAVLIGLALGAVGFTTTYNQLAELPSSTPSQVAFNTMASAFPAGALGPTQVYVVSKTSAPLNDADISALSASLSKTTGVAQVGAPQFTASHAQASLSVLLKDDPYSVTAIDNVAGPVRSAASPNAVPGATTYVGGTTSQLVDVRNALRHDMEHVFPLALLIVAVILALLLRSLVAPDLAADRRSSHLCRHPRRHHARLPGRLRVRWPRLHHPHRRLSLRHGHRHRLQHPYFVAPARRIRGGARRPRGISPSHHPRLTGSGRGLDHPGRNLRLAAAHRHPAARGDRSGRRPRRLAGRQRVGCPHRPPPWPPFGTGTSGGRTAFIIRRRRTAARSLWSNRLPRPTRSFPSEPRVFGPGLKGEAGGREPAVDEEGLAREDASHTARGHESPGGRRPASYSIHCGRPKWLPADALPRRRPDGWRSRGFGDRRCQTGTAWPDDC
jgi:RND superfamily putative drug exporter